MASATRSVGDEVITEALGSVGYIKLNRAGSLNALDIAFSEAIDSAVLRFERDPGIKVLHISSMLKHFCAGADIAEMSKMTAAQAKATAFVGCVREVSRAKKPVVVAVNGIAAGAGCELVEMCDVVVAAESARFMHPEITLAAMSGAGGIQRFARVAGKHVAMDVMLTGRALSASEAHAAGLVSRVVADDDLFEVGRQVAERIAGHSGPVARRIKATIDATRQGIEQGLVDEMNAFQQCFAEPDFREGLEAFLQKRKPDFRMK